MECRFTQELKQKILKDARDRQLQKKYKLIKRDKDDILEERRMISIQVGPCVFSKPVFFSSCFKIIVFEIGQQFKFLGNSSEVCRWLFGQSLASEPHTVVQLLAIQS